MTMPLQRVPSPPEEEAMTYDEISMQQSRQFLDNLQELKNLRPQLYSAAEYCELSYMNSDHKQMIVENLKDYAVRALVNTVDHLGSVSYKLNDLVNQQTNEVSATQLRIACLEQRLHTCQEYTDLEGLRQQCLVESIPRYHKHYVLPGSTTRDSEAIAEKMSDTSQEDEQRIPQPVRPEDWAALNLNLNASFRNDFQSMPSAECETFFFSDTEVSIPSVSTQYSRIQSASMTPGSSSFAVGRRVSSKALTKMMQFVLECSDCTNDNHKNSKELTSCLPS
eukprot:Gb_22978 [translate_table: standard]